MADLVAFARVSTQRQAQFGESLAEQFERIETYARQNQHTIIGRFADEGLSGRTLVGRDGIQQAVALTCRQGPRLPSLSRGCNHTVDPAGMSAGNSKRSDCCAAFTCSRLGHCSNEP